MKKLIILLIVFISLTSCDYSRRTVVTESKSESSQDNCCNGCCICGSNCDCNETQDSETQDNSGNIYTNPVKGQLYRMSGGIGGLW